MNASKADKEYYRGHQSDTNHSLAKQLKKAKKAEGWASKVKVKGDIRLRYQWQDTDGGIERNRGRYRARLGIIGKPVDNWEAGIGIASGETTHVPLMRLSTTPLKPKMLEWTMPISNIRKII